MTKTMTAAQYRAQAKKKRSKYGNVATKVDGILFHSKREALRWLALKDRQRHGEISGLERQVPFDLVVEGKHICKLVIDFRYFEGLVWVCEDSKGGIQTPASKIKMALAAALYPNLEWRLS